MNGTAEIRPAHKIEWILWNGKNIEEVKEFLGGYYSRTSPYNTIEIRYQRPITNDFVLVRAYEGNYIVKYYAMDIPEKPFIIGYDKEVFGGLYNKTIPPK